MSDTKGCTKCGGLAACWCDTKEQEFEKALDEVLDATTGRNPLLAMDGKTTAERIAPLLALHTEALAEGQRQYDKNVEYIAEFAVQEKENDTLADAYFAIEQRLAEALKDAGRLREFVEWCMKSPWQGCDLDGGDVQDKAEALGLIVKVPADEAFKDEYDADEMFVPVWSAAAMAASEPEMER